MKRHILILLSIISLTLSCQKPPMEGSDATSENLYAKIESNTITKTKLGESNNVLWSENDQIIAFMRSSYGHRYKILPAFSGKTYADFAKVSSDNGDNLSAGIELDHIIAYYPYSNEIFCHKGEECYNLDITLPSTQSYCPRSFDSGAFPMVAVSEDNDITFRNICGGINLQLKGSQTISSIKIEGNNNEKISGTAVVKAYFDKNKPTISMSDQALDYVTLNCESGVPLNKDTVTEFIIVLAPVTFTNGFSVTVTDINNNVIEFGTDKSNTISRSSLLKMPVIDVDDKISSDSNPEVDEEYITFEDPIAELVCLNKYDSNSDGKLSLNEVSTIERIDSRFFGEYASGVKSFNELRHFVNLKGLYNAEFHSCTMLESITLPDNIEKIGFDVFKNCKALNAIVIPAKVNQIGSYAFYSCYSLTEINIPDSVTQMGVNAFDFCTKLSSVTIGDGLKAIPESAFYDCHALSTIKFGKNIESIGKNAFGWSSKSSKIKDVIIVDLDKWLNVKFGNMDSVPTIYDANLWEGDRLITECTIPAGQTIVGLAVMGCGSIEEVTIPDDVLIIEANAFWGCSKLTKVKIGKDVTSIGEDAFYACSNLSNFEGKFASSDGRCLVVDGKLLALAANGLTEYTIPTGITTLSTHCGSTVNTLEKVIIGNDVESIEDLAFYCSGIKEVIITDKVKSIGEDAFGWTPLQTVYCNLSNPPVAEYDFTWGAFYNTDLQNIYVPAESLDLYLASDGWKDYSEFIRSMNLDFVMDY